MNCRLCGTHILTTMQIMWNGYPYHPDCIGEAVAQKRAEEESFALRASGASGDYDQSEEYDEPFDDEFADYENDDDLDDIIEHLDEMPDVSDGVLNQIPVSSANGDYKRCPCSLKQTRSNRFLIIF